MKQCDKCGTNNTENAKYCLNCGFELPINTVIESQEKETIPTKKKKKLNQAKTILGAVVGVLIMFGIQQFFFMSQAPTIDKAMMQLASEINKSCPIMIDAETRLDNSVALPNHLFVYNYTLINVEAGTIDTLQIKSKLEPIIVNFIKTNPQMKQVRDEKVTISYYYKDKNAKYLFQIPVTPQQYE